MENLFPCASALNTVEIALKVLAKRGVNDKTEKVRLAACHMLNKLDGHRFIKVAY